MPARIKSECVDETEPMQVDDEVVREIDVYLSPELATQLYLLQYPLQQGAATDAAPPISARIKPLHGMMELDQSLAASIEKQGDFSNMTKRTFTSHTIPIQSHVCLGKMQAQGDKSALHLVPLTHMGQMRPSFRHVDEKAKSSDNGGSSDETEKEDEKAIEKKPLVFQRKESERAAMARRSSYAFKKASEDSEEWQNLTVCGKDSIERGQVLKQVVCSRPNQSVLASDELTDDDPNVAYVRSLNYLQPTQDHTRLLIPRGNELQDVVARLTTLIVHGQPIPYSILRAQFASVPEDDFWTALNVCAVIVRGNLCLRSKFLSSMPSILHQARTFILLLMQTEGILHRRRLEHVFCNDTRVTSEHILRLLQQVCQRTPAGWTLKIEDDAAVLDRYPEQATLHQQYWERQAERYASWLDSYRTGPVTE